MKYVGYIGLGKMGVNHARRLKNKGFTVRCFNRGEEGRKRAWNAGLSVVNSLAELFASLPVPRTIWIMVTHGGVDAVLNDMLPYLSKGDTVIDGGNCFFKDTERRATFLKKVGIHFLDAGVSGGPSGALSGACIMVGGDKKDFKRHKALFRASAVKGGYLHVGRHGAGHFVKMVHNGIEYGMMQAIAEGFSVMRRSSFKLSLQKISELYNHKSVIESRLVGWLSSAYKKFGEDLTGVSGVVAHTGEGAWTVKIAKELGVRVPIIKGALSFRKNSSRNPSYQGKILSVLRNQFGGHDIKGSNLRASPGPKK